MGVEFKDAFICKGAFRLILRNVTKKLLDAIPSKAKNKEITSAETEYPSKATPPLHNYIIIFGLNSNCCSK